MRAVIVAVTAVVLCSAPAVAQQGSSVEIGTHVGLTVAVPDGGDAEVFAGVPHGGSVLGLWPAMFVTFLSSSNLMFEPQLFFSWNSISESALFQPVLQVGYLFTPGVTASPYVAAHGGGFFAEGDDSGLIGGGLGIHVRATEGFALRFEARYRRWLCEGCELNDISFLIGLAGVVK